LTRTGNNGHTVDSKIPLKIPKSVNGITASN
jgi:hypothetical protein